MEKEVKKRDLWPEGERARYLHGGRRISDGIWAGLKEGASKESGREKGHSAKMGETTLCASSNTTLRPR